MKIKVEEENAMDTSGAFDNGAEREGSMVKVEENDAMDTSDTFNHSPEMAVNHEQHNLQPSKRNAAPPPARIDPPVHQNRAAVPVLAQRNCDLWQLPMTPRAFKWARKHARYSESFYHKTCTMLEDKWSCSIAELLPANIRRHTPYSMAFLCHMRSLANHLKYQPPEKVLDLLLKAYEEREANETEEERETGLITTVTATLPTPGHAKQREREILEHRKGLMLIDISRAIQMGKNPALSGLPPAPVGRGAKKAAKRHALEMRNERALERARTGGSAPLPYQRLQRARDEELIDSLDAVMDGVRKGDAARRMKKEQTRANIRRNKSLPSERFQRAQDQEELREKFETAMGDFQEGDRVTRVKEEQTRVTPKHSARLPYERLQQAPLPDFSTLAPSDSMTIKKE